MTRATVEEVQKEVEELQVLAKQEAETLKRQALQALSVAKRLAPFAAAATVLFALLWRRRRKRRKLLAQTPVVIKEVVYAEE